jgi:hypothetical protein
MNAPAPNLKPVDPDAWLAGNQAILAADLDWLATLLTHPAGTDETGRQAARRAHAGPAALDELTRRCRLSAFERDTLLLAAAPELSGELAERLRQAGHANVSFGLALALLPEAHWSALEPNAPLRAWGLLRPIGDGPLADCRLRVDERILHYLTGLNRIDARLLEWLTPLSGGPSAPDEGPDSLTRRLADALDDPAAPLPWLTGGDRDARRAVLAAAASELSAQAWRLVPRALEDADFDLAEFLRLWRREALLAPQVLAVELDGLDRLPARWAEALVRLPAMAVLSPAPLPFDGGRPVLPLTLTEADHAARLAAWRTALAGHAVSDAFLSRLAAIFRHPPHSIALPARLCGAEAEAELWRACLTLTRAGLESQAECLTPRAAWADLVLPEEQAALLRRLVEAARWHGRVADEWGFAGRSTRGLGMAALFAGPSGTGKTLAAEVVAGALELDLYRVDLARVVSKYIGETEKNLARIFDAAEAGGAVLLFDEADALFGKRSEVKDSHDRYANIEVAYLLQRMEAYRGVAILTSNAEANLDAAFARRLRFVVRFPFPDQAARRAIWQRAFPPAAPLDGVDFERLARLPLSGGGIANVAFAAACRAAAAGRPIGMGELREAARAEAQKLERPWSDGWLRDPA